MSFLLCTSRMLQTTNTLVLQYTLEDPDSPPFLSPSSSHDLLLDDTAIERKDTRRHFVVSVYLPSSLPFIQTGIGTRVHLMKRYSISFISSHTSQKLLM